MNTYTNVLASVFALLATAGCSGPGPNDALTHTWSNADCFATTGMPADIQTCSTSIDFASDLSVSLIDSRQSQPATAVYPRCTTTRRVTGQRYSTSDPGVSPRTFTVTGSGSSTIERSGCANPTDNAEPVADSGESIPSGTITYMINENVLTIPSGSLEGTYNR